MGLDYESLDKRFDEILKNTTKEEIEEFFKQFPVVPKGWVSIEEHLPQLLAGDFINGQPTMYMVKDIDNNEFETYVCGDALIWKYDQAKPLNITHWWNEND